jgi:hypothetical protein
MGVRRPVRAHPGDDPAGDPWGQVGPAGADGPYAVEEFPRVVRLEQEAVGAFLA